MKFINQRRSLKAFHLYRYTPGFRYCTDNFISAQVSFQLDFVDGSEPQVVICYFPTIPLQSHFYKIMKNISCHISDYKNKVKL